MACTASRYDLAAVAASLLLAAAIAGRAEAASQLLYLEAQGIAGYSSASDGMIFYSMDPDSEMQKPAVGFDYIGRFSGGGGEWGSAALQGRLALVVDDGIERIEPQLYNAWLKLKTPAADLWIGHNRPAFGLGSYFDSHALLLRTLSMQGFGYDRDWGAGLYRDTEWGNLQFSATTGSGMPLFLKGNYMFAARVGAGVLNRDNWTAGVSAGQGMTLDTMGYDLRYPDPMEMGLLGADVAFLWDNVEHRIEFLHGRWFGVDTTAAIYRFGVLLDPDGKWKVEAQPSWWVEDEGTPDSRNWRAALCLTCRLNADLTLRALYEYDDETDDHRFILQLYEYRIM